VPVAHAQIHKCTVAGKTVYQQEPCGKNGSTGNELKVVVPSTTEGSSLSPELDRLRDDYPKAQKELDEAIAKHCADKKFDAPELGMSEADLKCIKRFRQPEKVNVTTTALGETKQYVFRERSRTTYIYFRNGKLETLQSPQ
jgi:hypothetical protein